MRLRSVMLPCLVAAVLEAQAPSDLYRASVAAAEGAIQATDSRAARAWLDLAPVGERGWEWYHYSRAITMATSVNALEVGALSDLDVSPFGEVAAVGTSAGSVLLLDLAGPSAPRTIARGIGEVYAVTFARDGRTVAVGSADRRIRLYDVATGTLRREIVTGTERALELVFDPTGERLVAAMTAGIVRSWSLASGDTIRSYLGHVARPPVPAVAILPSGEIVSGSWDNSIRVWDPVTAASTRTLGPGYGGASVSTRFSEVVVDPKGRFLAGSGSDGGVHVWSTTDWTERVFLGHEGDVPAMAISADGEYLATGGIDQSVRIWRVADGTAIANLLGHAGAVQAVSFRRDGRGVVSVGDDGSVREWSVASIERTNVPTKTSAYAIAWPEAGKQMLAGDFDGRLVLTDRGTGRAIREWQAHRAPIIGIDLTEDGLHALSLAQRGPLALWRLRDASLVRLIGDSTLVARAATMTPDGKLIATVGADRTVRAWDGETGRELRRRPAEEGRTPHMVRWLPGTRRVIVGWSDGVASIWDLESGTEGPTMKASLGQVVTIATEARTGRHFLGTDQGHVMLWDARSAAPSHSWQAHDGLITALEVSPRDRRLISVADDYILRVWSTETHKSLAAFRRIRPYCARFTPDGEALAVCGLDRRIRVLEGPVRR